MSGWDHAAEISAQVKTSYISLKNDGDKFVGVFLGEPHATLTIWENNRTVPFLDAHKAAGKSPKANYSINVWLADGSVRIWQMNNDTFKSLLAARKKYGLENKFFEIERHGGKGDTNTKYSILFDSEVPPADYPKIAAAKLFDLDKEDAAEDATAGDMDSYDRAKKSAPAQQGKGPALITSAQQQALIERLKSLPNFRELNDQFLKPLGLQRWKDLPADKFADADAFIARHEKEAGEIDPFAVE